MTPLIALLHQRLNSLNATTSNMTNMNPILLIRGMRMRWLLVWIEQQRWTIKLSRPCQLLQLSDSCLRLMWLKIAFAANMVEDNGVAYNNPNLQFQADNSFNGNGFSNLCMDLNMVLLIHEYLDSPSNHIPILGKVLILNHLPWLILMSLLIALIGYSLSRPNSSSSIVSLHLSCYYPTKYQSLTFSQAQQQLAWWDATWTKIVALHSYQTQILVPAPFRANIVGCKWVDMIKRHLNGMISHYRT